MSKKKFILPKATQIEEVFQMVLMTVDKPGREKLVKILEDDYLAEVDYDTLGVRLRSVHPKKNTNILHEIASGQGNSLVLRAIWGFLNMEMYNYKDDRGCTPLMVAISAGHSEIFQDLLYFQRKKLNFLEFPNVKIKQELKHTVNISNNNFQTPLHIAVLDNNIEQIKNLLSLGANPRARDNEGNTPAHLAAKNPFTCKEALKMLAAVFGDPGLKNNKGKTVLDIVRENSSFEAMQESDSKDYNDKGDGTWVNAKLNIVRKNSRFEPVQASDSKNHDNKKAEIFLDSSIQEIMKAFKKPNSFQEKFMHVGNRMSFRGL